MKRTITQSIRVELSYLMKLNGNPLLNSHAYRVEATICNNSNIGRMMDFEDVSKLLFEAIPTNSFLISTSSEEAELEVAKALKQFGVPVIVYSEELCTENLLMLFVKSINQKLVEYSDSLSSYELVELKLWETDNYCATYVA